MKTAKKISWSVIRKKDFALAGHFFVHFCAVVLHEYFQELTETF